MQYIDYLADCLPQTPSDDLERFVEEHCDEELGGHMLVFKRERVEVAAEDMRDCMDPEDMERYVSGIRGTWGARCTCTACGDDFLSGYFSDKLNARDNVSGIYLAQGECGEFFPGYIAPDSPDCPIQIAETDHIDCPMCGTDVQLVRHSDIKNGRTYQCAVQSVENIGGYTALITWLACRKIDSLYEEADIRPRDALVIDRDGRLHRFCRTWYGMYGERDAEQWRPVKTVRDGMQMRYYSYDACNHRQIGGRVFDKVPDLAGTTGEKTGMAEYIASGGRWPGIYLQTWEKRRNIENLVKSGWAQTVASAISDEEDEAFNTGCGGAPLETAKMAWVNWEEVKPHLMLWMAKDDMRRLLNRGSTWDAKTAALWQQYYLHYDDTTALVFDDLRRTLTMHGLEEVMHMDADGADGWPGFDPRQVASYCKKQRRDGQSGFVRYFIDYRKMLRAAGHAETDETLWPRDLTAAHDTAICWIKSEEDNAWAKAFASTYQKCRDLEWTDGALCIRIPQKNSELVREGDVLRHCVGGYGKDHAVDGKLVFFVRHYRRPERSYYTLNIDMTGSMPREIQLHGYGNERHGDRKQYAHTIPQAVRDFCDRWEREVLTPWFAAKRKPEKKEKKARRSA